MQVQQKRDQQFKKVPHKRSYGRFLGSALPASHQLYNKRETQLQNNINSLLFDLLYGFRKAHGHFEKLRQRFRALLPAQGQM